MKWKGERLFPHGLPIFCVLNKITCKNTPWIKYKNKENVPVIFSTFCGGFFLLSKNPRILKMLTCNTILHS